MWNAEKLSPTIIREFCLVYINNTETCSEAENVVSIDKPERHDLPPVNISSELPFYLEVLAVNSFIFKVVNFFHKLK